MLQISEDTVQRYVNAKAESVPEQVEVSALPKKPLTVEMDELWSFVDEKDNEQWVWLALDAQTREIVGVHIGDRSAQSAKALWNSMPGVYRLRRCNLHSPIGAPTVQCCPRNVIGVSTKTVG